MFGRGAQQQRPSQEEQQLPQPQVLSNSAGTGRTTGQGHGVSNQSAPPLADHVVITLNTNELTRPATAAASPAAPTNSQPAQQAISWQQPQWQPQQVTYRGMPSAFQAAVQQQHRLASSSSSSAQQDRQQEGQDTYDNSERLAFARAPSQQARQSSWRLPSVPNPLQTMRSLTAYLPGPLQPARSTAYPQQQRNGSLQPARSRSLMSRLGSLGQLPGRYNSYTASGALECRICLLSDPDGEPLIHPCACTGSMAAVHYSCLSKWAAEKRSVVCELCKQEYKEPYLTQIKEVVEGRPPPPQPVMVTQYMGPPVGGPAAYNSAANNWMTFWCHMGILVILLAAILYLTIFANSNSSSNDWANVLWRVLIVVIPVYLVGRIFWIIIRKACLEDRVRRRARANAANANGAARTGAAPASASMQRRQSELSSTSSMHSSVNPQAAAAVTAAAAAAGALPARRSNSSSREAATQHSGALQPAYSFTRAGSVALAPAGPASAPGLQQSGALREIHVA